MHSWIDTATIRKIDSATFKHGCIHGDLNELEQLAVLFQPPYIRDLYSALAPRPGKEAARRSLNIKLGWIDKIPLAKTKLFLERVELGDLAIFAIDQYVDDRKRPVGPPQARAVIVQAKVVRALKCLRKPLVPGALIKGSTSRELMLLSKWPELSLYKASNSANSLVDKIDLRGKMIGPLPYGWYVAAPCDPKGRLSNPSEIWPSWWMAGPPIQSDPMDISFGRFLHAFLSATPIPTSACSLAVGERFDCASYPPRRDGHGWDRVCAEILTLLEEGDAPQHIFGHSRKRISSLRPILSQFLSGGSGPMYFAPRYAFPKRPGYQRPVFRREGSGWLRRLPSEMESELGHKMPVLVIHNTIVEG